MAALWLLKWTIAIFHPKWTGGCGEHSFANDMTPIACGRSEEKDLEEIIRFGLLIRNKIKDAGGIEMKLSAFTAALA